MNRIKQIIEKHINDEGNMWRESFPLLEKDLAAMMEKDANEWREARIGNMPEYGTDILFLNANGGYWATKYYSQYNHMLGSWYTHYQIIKPLKAKT